MNARPRLSNLIGFVVAIGACSSSDTILALTVTSGADIGAVETLHVTVTPASGTAFTFDFAPPLVDGSIKSSFFERIKLPSGMDGPALVTVEAQNAAHATTASGQTQTSIVKDGAVAASVMLMPGGLPPPGDGGADASDAAAGGDAPHDGGTDGGGGGDASDGPAGDAAGDTGAG